MPDEFDATDPQAVSRIYSQLEERDVPTRQSLEDFILDWEEFGATIFERYSEAYVDMTADTTNPEYETTYIKIVEEIMPIVEQRDFNLKQKVLSSPGVGELGSRYEVFLRNIRSEVELFREENIPLQTEDIKMGQEAEKISGGQSAEFRGVTYTLPQLAPFFEETDPNTREGAWRARAETFLKDAQAFDDLYDRMYQVRRQTAQNAGFSNFRDYKFKQLKRFDYTPEDCLQFHDAIEKHIVPFMSQEYERWKGMLGVETLRPWDVGIRPGDPVVDPEGGPPLRPFDTVERLRDGCQRIFDQVDQELGGYFRTMIEDGLLDLENRPGKSPGGYMTSFPDRRVPFIFMNAVGTKRDVDTLLHEGGHAFHYFMARQLALHSYHYAGTEFSEVASQGMELLARPYLGEFYAESDLERLLDDQLRTTLKFFPWMAMIDAFQHWVYTAEDQSAQARRAKWAELENRFRPGIDWSGLEQYRDIGWQYPHVFDSPFYYVEYGIAQLAALRIWLTSLDDESGAVEAYKRGLSLGGSRPLPDLFNAVGADLAFNDATVSAIAQGTLAQIKKQN